VRLTSVFLAGVALLSGFSASADVPPAGQVYVNGITAGGSGCRQGTYGAYLSEDQQAFTLMFDSFTATQSPGSSPAEARVFCNINLDLHVPHGWQFTVLRVDFRGYANLDRGARGVVQSTYRFSGGSTVPVPLRIDLQGPISSDYTKSDDVGLASRVWSPCGVNRALNIKADVRIEGPRHINGLMTMDTIDGEFRQIYAMQWRRC
jgi:hypothetical protein